MKRGFRVPNPKTQNDGEEAGRESGQRAAVGGRGRAGGQGAAAANVRRITNLLMKIKQGTRTQRDVKNEGCSQDLIENKGA
jgi:hypothetical protein